MKRRGSKLNKLTVVMAIGSVLTAAVMLAATYGCQGRLDEAVAGAEKAREEASREPVDAKGMAAAQQAVGRSAKASERLTRPTAELEAAIDSAATPDEVIQLKIRLGDVLAEAGRTEEALTHYQAVVDMFPDDLQATRHGIARLTFLYQREEGPEAAISKLQAIAAAHRETKAEACASYEVAAVYESEALTVAAITSYEDVARRFPDSAWGPEALKRIVRMYQSRGESQNAIETAKRIEAQYPGSPSALGALGTLCHIYATTGRLDEAMATLREVVRRDPKGSLAFLVLRTLCRVSAPRNRLEDVASLAAELAQEHPEVDWKSRMGQICYVEGIKMAKQGRTACAIRLWEQAASLHDRDAVRAEMLVHIGTGWACFRQYEKARDAMRRVLENASPAFVKRHLLAMEFMADLYWQEGKRELALAAMREALSMAVSEGETTKEEAIRSKIARLQKELGEQD